MARMNRRKMLQLLGVGAGMLPLLPSELARSSTGYPRRLVVVCMPNGVMSEFWPVDGSTETDFTFGWVSEDLQEFEDDLIVMRGLEIRGLSDGRAAGGGGGGHETVPFLLSGGRALWDGGSFGSGKPRASDGPTIDQWIAARIAEEVTLPYQSLALNIQPAHYGVSGTHLSWLDADRPLANRESPYELFDEMFGRGAIDVAEQERRRFERQSVLSAVRGEIGALRRRISGEDRIAFDAHLESVQELEARLGARDGLGGCVPPALGEPIDIDAPENFDLVSEAHLDLLTSALACDVTRVVTLFWRNSTGGGQSYYPWLGEDFIPRGEASYTGQSGDAMSDHNIAHDTRSGREEHLHRKRVRDQYFVNRFAGLLRRMKSVPEGDGTLLDNSAVVLLSTMSHGASHGWKSIPVVVAGSCGGRLSTGRYIDAGRVEHNKLLGTLAYAMGYPVETFGYEGYDATPFDQAIV